MKFKHNRQRKAVMAKLKKHEHHSKPGVSCQPVYYDHAKKKWVRIK